MIFSDHGVNRKIRIFRRKSDFVTFLHLEQANLLQKNTEKTNGRKYENFQSRTDWRTDGGEYIGPVGGSKKKKEIASRYSKLEQDLSLIPGKLGHFQEGIWEVPMYIVYLLFIHVLKEYIFHLFLYIVFVGRLD